MAEFCNQCCRDMDFPEGELAELCAKDHVALVLCEGCGATWVDSEGNCTTDCLLHHVPEVEKKA